MQAKPYLIPLQTISTPEKAIHVAEFAEHMPFEVKRSYWIVPKTTELTVGNHAHRHLSQVFIALQGQIEVSLTALGGENALFALNVPSEGLFVPPMYWKSLRFSPDAILLCLTSHAYDEGDYIKDLDVFLSLGKQ